VLIRSVALVAGNPITSEVDIFDPDYMAKLEKIKLPNTRIKLLQQLLAKAIAEFKKVNTLRHLICYFYLHG
jgi:type I restriction enzyme R subunit